MTKNIKRNRRPGRNSSYSVCHTGQTQFTCSFHGLHSVLNNASQIKCKCSQGQFPLGNELRTLQGWCLRKLMSIPFTSVHCLDFFVNSNTLGDEVIYPALNQTTLLRNLVCGREPEIERAPISSFSEAVHVAHTCV